MNVFPLQVNPLPEAQRSTPAGKSTPSHILYVRFDPTLVTPVLSVQREFNLTSGIRRGYQDYAGRLILDHVIGPRGQLLFGNDMRLGTVSVWEHQIRVVSEKIFGARRVLAIVGNGNLTQNPYFIAWERHGGEMVRLSNEPITDRTYDCIVVPPGRKSSIQSLRFQTKGCPSDQAGWVPVNASSGEDLSQAIEVAFSGQRLVIDGKPLSREQLNSQILSGLYYDLRHVFRFPALKSGSYWKDLGLEQFYDHGSINRLSVSQALSGEPITTRWKDLTDDKEEIRKALHEKGYEESQDKARGTYRFEDDYINIVYLDAIYCHNVLGLDHDGFLACLQVTGRSNNVGATLEALSNLAARAFKDALLLDNGGDVFFLRNDDPHERTVQFKQLPDGTVDALVKSCLNRYSIRAAILFVSAADTVQDKVIDFRTID